MMLFARVGAARLPQPRVIGPERACGTERFRQCLELGLHELVVLLADRVVDPRSLATCFDDACSTQDAELTRNVRLTQIECLLQMADAKLAMGEQRNDAQPRFVAECTEQLRQGTNVQVRSTGEHAW